MDQINRNLISVLFFWIISLVIISFLGFKIMTDEVISGEKSYLTALANWDGQHFLGIAEKGYVKQIQYAFFPLYPLLIKYLGVLGVFPITGGLLISLTSTFSAIFLLKKLLLLDFSKEIVGKIILFLIVFPTSFFLLVVYSEGLFLFLTILVFFFARLREVKSKDKYLQLLTKFNYPLATLFAILASDTRIVGLAVVLALWVEVYFDKKGSYRWVVLLAPLGIGFYCLFLFLNTGNPFYFLVAEKNWDREIVFPGFNILRSISFIVDFGLTQKSLVALIDLIFTIFGFGLALRSFRFLRPSYSVYGMSCLLIPLFTSSLGSIPRFLIVIFPIFIILGRGKNIGLQIKLLFFSTLFLGLNVILFINNFWVS